MTKSFFILILAASVAFFSCKPEVAEPDKVDMRAEISLESGWDVVQNDEDSEFEDVTYHCNITKDPADDTKIIINKFHNEDDAKISVTIYDDRTLQITKQKVGDTNIEIEGTGSISSNFQRIEWNYTANGSQVTAIFSPGTVTKKTK